jgi:transposase
MPKKYRVRLSALQREQLEKLIGSGTAPSRTLTHARILLKADHGEFGPAWRNQAIAAALEISEPTITRVRKRFSEEGLEAALHRKEQARRRAPRLDGSQEAHLIALVCGPAPDGHARWSLRLLAERMVSLGHAAEISHETVRQVLKKGRSSPG